MVFSVKQKWTTANAMGEIVSDVKNRRNPHFETSDLASLARRIVRRSLRQTHFPAKNAQEKNRAARFLQEITRAFRP
jgi:hypothetical protein